MSTIHRDMAITSLAVSFGLWFFQDALSETFLDQELIRQSVINETILTVGQPGPCSTQVHLSVWKNMNQLGIYRWVIACEEATK